MIILYYFNKYLLIHFYAALNNILSSLIEWLTYNNPNPLNSYKIIPDVTIGEIPNSIKVPLFEANITLIQ